MLQGVRTASSRRSLLLQELLIGQMATVAGAFVINLLSARAMGPENRGEIALVLQLSYVAGALVVLGRDRAVLQADLGEGGATEARGVMRALVRAPLGLILAVGIAFGVWRALLDGSVVMTLGFLLLLLGNLASRFFRSSAIVEGHGRTFMTATIFGQIGLVIAGGSLLVTEISSVAPWLLVYGACLSLPFLVLVLRRGPRGDRVVPAEQVRPVRAIGLGFLPSELMDMAMTKADKLLLPLLSSYAVMGYYTVAVSLVDFALMPFSQYVDSRIPRWAALHRARALRFREILPRPLALATAVVGVVAVGSYVAIPLLFGTEYLPARKVVPVLALATFCHIVSIFAAAVATAIGSPNVLIRMHLSGIGVIIPLLVVLIPEYGAAGAAVAQAAGFAVSATVGIVLIRSRIGRSGEEVAR